jgi:hypothetical protein
MTAYNQVHYNKKIKGQILKNKNDDRIFLRKGPKSLDCFEFYLWHDFANTKTITLDTSNRIKQINDLSFFNVTMYQDNPDERPDLIENGLNGLPIARFNRGWDDGMGNRYGWNHLTSKHHKLYDGEYFTFMVVAKTGLPEHFFSSIVSFTNDAQQGGKKWEIQAGHDKDDPYFPQFDGNLAGNIFRGHRIPFNQQDVQTWNIWEWTYDYPNRIATLFFNGVVVNTAEIVKELDPDGVYKYALNRDTFWHLEVDIAEVVAFNPKYRINIEGYLASKWGLQYKLPTDHPFYKPL